MDELDEAQHRLASIEEDLRFEIQRALDGFKKQFGIPVTAVYVDVPKVEVTTLGDPGPKYEIGRVSVRLVAEISAKT